MTGLAHRSSWIAFAALFLGMGAAGVNALTTPPGDKSTEPVRRVVEWNLGKEKLAIQGFDPVAYFPEGGGAATKGDENITAEYGGVLYRFASVAHSEKFLANPARYEPAHGGWCSYAMLEGDKVQVDPRSFIVQDGRLFLFYKGFLGDTRAKWLKANHATEAKTADAMWKVISGEAARTSEESRSDH